MIVATGVRWRRLDVPALNPLIGHGVFYGAGRLDIEAMDGRHVFIIGAGNSAGQAAVALAERASSVTFVIRGTSRAASMSDYLVTRLRSTPNVEVRGRSAVVDASGRRRAADGGVRGSVALDDRGFVLTGAAAAR